MSSPKGRAGLATRVGSFSRSDMDCRKGILGTPEEDVNARNMNMSIENLKKHVGTLSNTGVRVVVVFRALPNDAKHCLIMEIERLPDSYQDYVSQCLNSPEAMSTNNFYEVLNRRQFSDGSNCLTALHQRGYLRKEPVSNITMIPLPNRPVPLALINSEIDKTAYVADEVPPEVFEIDPLAYAKNLIKEASDMETAAQVKRDEAYALVPELKPTKGRPALSEEDRAMRKEEIKVQRLERDRKNSAQAKVDKRETMLDDKVNAKVMRDALAV